MGCYLERMQIGLSVAHNYTVCCKSRQLRKETVKKQSDRGKVTLTTDFDLHGADAIELRHAFDFRK